MDRLKGWITLALLAALCACGKEDRPPEVDALTKLRPGMTALLKSAKQMRYFLRVPKSYNATTGARLIVFLHGSNMNGLAYLRSFEGKKWCEDDILCCPNGENGTEPYGANNFGFDSAPLVAGITEELQKTFKTTITYVGGHSQGAFLTYSVITNYPDLYRGAFPMAGDCWIQNEPVLWEDKPDVLKKQKDIAIAVIHGKADPVVPFSQGEHAYDCFRAMGWTRLRLFAPAKLNHMFMLAPIDEALDWLDAMNGRNPQKTQALAAAWARDQEWGWVLNAASRMKPTPTAMLKAAEDSTAKALPAVTEALKGKPADWIPKWIEFKRVYGDTSAAKALLATAQTERERQRETGARLYNEAQGLFRSEKKDEAYKVLEKLRDEAPYTYHGYFGWKWVGERK